jgi:methionyl-tRNA formyltransferase
VRVAIIGQQDFGKAVLEAMLGRGDTVAGVFCAPELPGAKPDPLRTAAQERQRCTSCLLSSPRKPARPCAH